MKKKIIDFLRILFPFLLTIGLWRLSAPFWNPAGILAIIPMFFCVFIRPTNWFLLFSVIMCVAIDYKFETVCFWMALFCLFYAINCFQNFIDVSRMDFDGIWAFLSFFGLAVFIQVLSDLTFINLLRGAWLVLWAGMLYIPITSLIKKVQK